MSRFKGRRGRGRLRPAGPGARRGALALALAGAALLSGAAKRPRAAAAVPLASRSAGEILDRYTFVGDFDEKDAERPVSTELFWRYPYPLPKVEFPLRVAFDDPKTELPATKGEGRATSHLNRGRVLFLNGQYAEAKATWLSARARYGSAYPFHRRNDYFIGYAFLNVVDGDRKAKGLGYDAPEIKNNMANAATFLSWAFIVKADQPDPLVEAATPKGLYNLAATYWRYGRYAGAYGAADTALNFLRKTGRKELRPAFHRILAESFIRNRSYLQAVQELDVAIRQDRDAGQAAAAFARVGDIYFDLNNYDLAEDAYALGARLDETMPQPQINPAQLVLRGESLFWLGRFSEAQKILHFALEGGAYRAVARELAPDAAAWAALRIADAFLARRELAKARLEYYKVGHEYRGALAGRIAKVRQACLELPFYDGNNVMHARELLEEAKAGVELPAVARELAWACQVGSYTDRERTPEMLARVKAFAEAYPESAFLRQFAGPVRAYQAGHIEGYFKAQDLYRALSFFEKNRRALFPTVPVALGAQLFAAYADVRKPEAAAEFWDAYARTPDADLKLLRQATVAAEVVSRRAKGPWPGRDQGFQRALPRRAWQLTPEPLPVGYLDRMQLVSSAEGHLPWMYNLARHFGEIDDSYVCDLEYPLLSRLSARGAAFRGLVTQRTGELIGRQLPELFRHDESCALSLLELEAARLTGEPKTLAALYQKRAAWPLVAGFLHLYWMVSERVYDGGEKASARKLWEVIRDKGPPASPEVEFAKARLDPGNTEFEKLWD